MVRDFPSLALNKKFHHSFYESPPWCQMASAIVFNFSTRCNVRSYIPSPHRPPTSFGVQFPAVAEVLLFVVMSILILQPIHPTVQLAVGLFSRGSSGREAK